MRSNARIEKRLKTDSTKLMGYITFNKAFIE